MDNPLTLSVIMPVYNEEDSIAPAVQEVQREVLDRIPGSELIVVNDGSTDGTSTVLLRLALADPRICALQQRNAGHGAALRTGLEAAKGEWLFLIDSDRQIPVEAFEPLWREARQNREAVWGVRSDRQDPPARLFLTRVIRGFNGLLFGIRVRDANVPFKLMRRRVWQSAKALIPEGTLAPSLFLALFVGVRGLPHLEMEVPHRPRLTGVSTLHPWRLFRFCAQAFAQLLVFRMKL